MGQGFTSEKVLSMLFQKSYTEIDQKSWNRMLAEVERVFMCMLGKKRLACLLCEGIGCKQFTCRGCWNPWRVR